MQLKLIKLLIVGAVLTASLVGAGVASATTWHTNGALNFSATTGATKLLDTATGAGLTCAGTTVRNGATGTLAPNRINGAGIATVTPTFSDCMVSGVRFTVSCSGASLNGLSWDPNGGTTPNWYESLTQGTVTNLNCNLVIPNCATTVMGLVNDAEYQNPTSVAAGRLTISSSRTTQTLTIINSGGATCTALRLNNGDGATFSDGSGASVVYTVTVPSAFASQPRIWVTNP